MAGGRIPEAFIQDLLARVDIVEVIRPRVELQKAGREWKARSPFTSEKSPSFFVSPAKQMFFCFSSGKSGNAIKFLMEYERLSYPEAIEEIAGRLGIPVPREAGNGGAPSVASLAGPLEALALAERLWRLELKKSPIAIEYLKKRGVSGETAQRFGLGFAPDTWDFLARQAEPARAAIDAGLLIEREHEPGRAYDRFRNRVMFPIRDTRGRVIGFGGRTLGDDPAKYLNSPETALFHKGKQLYGLFEARAAVKGALAQIVVVEGYMDVVMLAQHGLTETVATLGTATTREQLELLYRHTPRVVFCFDGDRAGRSAAWRALEQILPVIGDTRECAFLFLPDGQDPDTWVQEIGAEEFRAHLVGAESLLAFLLRTLMAQADLSTPDGRARLIGLARPHYAALPTESALRAALVSELARLTQIPEAQVALTLARGGTSPAGARATGRPSRGGDDAGPAVPAGQGHRRVTAPLLEQPVRDALAALLEQPELALGVGDIGQLAEAPAEGLSWLIEALDFFSAHPDANAAVWLATLNDPRLDVLVTQLPAGSPVEDSHPATGTDAARAYRFAAAITHLRVRALKARARTLSSRALSVPERHELTWLHERLREAATAPAGDGSPKA